MESDGVLSGLLHQGNSMFSLVAMRASYTKVTPCSPWLDTMHCQRKVHRDKVSSHDHIITVALQQR